jgi:hypothetical protein
VAAVTAPRRSLLGKLGSTVAARRKPGRPGKLAAFAVKAREHMVTAAALASVDVGVFHYGAGPGWIVTGVSLLALDFAVQG